MCQVKTQLHWAMGWASAGARFETDKGYVTILAGAGNMQTLLILGSEKAVDQFRSGAKAGPVVLGQDLSLGKKLGFDVIDDTNIFNSREVITHSIQDGHLVDWSLIGASSDPHAVHVCPGQFCKPESDDCLTPVRHLCATSRIRDV